MPLVPEFQDIQYDVAWHDPESDFRRFYSSGDNFFCINRKGFDPHTATDCWKLHVSVNKDQLETAWNLLANHEDFLKCIHVLKVSIMHRIEKGIQETESEINYLSVIEHLFNQLKKLFQEPQQEISDYLKLMEFIYSEFIAPSYQLPQLTEKDVIAFLQHSISEADIKSVTNSLFPASRKKSGIKDIIGTNSENLDKSSSEIVEKLTQLSSEIVEKYYLIFDKNFEADCDNTDYATPTVYNGFQSKQQQIKELISLVETFYELHKVYLEKNLKMAQRVFLGGQITIYVPNDVDIEPYKTLIPLIDGLFKENKIRGGIIPESDLALGTDYISVRHELMSRDRYDPMVHTIGENPFQDFAVKSEEKKQGTFSFALFRPQFQDKNNNQSTPSSSPGIKK